MVARPERGEVVNKPHDDTLPEIGGYQLHLCGEGDETMIGITFFDHRERPICDTHMTLDGAEDYVSGIIEAIRELRRRLGLREH